MRHFRRDITELCLDPVMEPGDFQRHLWRYPVRIDIAREYLGITAEEHELLFTWDAVTEPQDSQLTIRELYGFPSDTVGDRAWTDIATAVPEFLARTGLGYCEFRELWRSGFVPFRNDGRGADADFPDCEPCDLTNLRIRPEADDTADVLRKLAIFIRLWHKVRDRGYSFTQLRDICEVLQLFTDEGRVNPDFVRQLAAFQMLRDDFGLALTGGDPPAEDATGAARTRLLALWTGPGSPGWDWALGELCDRIQHHAQDRHHCPIRSRTFVKLLVENLDPLSELVGFSPADAADTWHARPTHTLRFAEVLAKIYASDFGVGEILFLFSNSHVDGDDPFPRQPDNEALDSPLGLPDDESTFSLWALRDKLRDADVSDDDIEAWDWPRIESAFLEQFALSAGADRPDALWALGEHCFPSVLEAAGHRVTAQRSQYRVELGATTPRMWNTPSDGPFHYDTVSKQLWAQLPLTGEAVIEKTSRVRQLNPEEQMAVRRLCFLPRCDLAALGFLFTDLADAERHLLEEPDEQRRWAYFRRAFVYTYRRCEIISEHLAGHVADQTGDPDRSDPGLAWRLLRHLFADENRATAAWENDAGTRPGVTWPDQPAGAFTALLGLCGTGLPGEFSNGADTPVWREIRGLLDAFGQAQNARNAPVPTVLPNMSFTLPAADQRFVSVRNGFALANPNGELLGGAQGFAVRWSGSLLIEQDGAYEFQAGAPAPGDEPPGFEAVKDQRWRVRLSRGQRVWVLLNHRWHEEHGPSRHSAPVTLRRGTYHLTIDLTRPEPAWGDPGPGDSDVHPINCGFQLKYTDPAHADKLTTVPVSQLFMEYKDATLADGLPDFNDVPQRLLSMRYCASLRDIRRTYQRAFKALLFASRFALSAAQEADDGQSEIGYLLAHPQEFAGTSSYRSNGGFDTHHACFDFNLLPLNDNFRPPSPAQDLRTFPSARRRQALFDWWERIFDYTQARTAARAATGRPLWLLFHEAAENHPDDPAQLVWYLGVDISHRPLITGYFAGTTVSTDDLTDERWPLRVWHADAWIRARREHFMEKDMRTARPDLWAADDPGTVAQGDTESGNDNLLSFVREGCVDNGEPHRYEDLKRLNDGLRERGRQALLAYLCGMDRVPLPWGTETVTAPHELSGLLLLDVEAGRGEFASRAEEAIGAVQAFVQRARLGLEPQWPASPAFTRLWGRRYATYRVWEADQRRTVYREDWIEWDELVRARESEAFQFLEAELRRSVLTVPVSGGIEYFSRRRRQDGLAVLQDEPSRIQRLNGAEGFGLRGTPETHARPSWLSTVHTPGDNGHGTDDTDDDGPVLGLAAGAAAEDGRLPLWIQAAVRLGTRFVRVAAAAEPPAAAGFRPRPSGVERPCCQECGERHPPVVDEYYFWLLDSRHFGKAEPQDALWSWSDPSIAPGLLRWASLPGVRLAWSRVHNGRFSEPRCSTGLLATDDAAARLLLLGRTDDSLTFEVHGADRPPGHDPNTRPGFRYDLPTDRAVSLPLVAGPGTYLTAGVGIADTTVKVASTDELPAAFPYRLILDPSTATREILSVTGSAGKDLTVIRGMDGTGATAHAQGARAVHRPPHPGRLAAHPYFAHFSPGAPLTPASPFAPVIALAGTLRSHCRFEAALGEYEKAFAPLRSDTTWMRCLPEKGVVCCHDSTVATEGQTRQRAITLHYLETLVQWRACLVRERTREALQHARIVHNTAARILGPRPRTVVADGGHPQDGQSVASFVPHPAAPNPRLMALYEDLEDIPAPLRGDAPENEWCNAPRSPYRFTTLLQRAQTLTGELRTLANALHAAYERGDAEYLASIRATHERQLLDLALEVRQQQWREADWQLQALRKTQEIIQARFRYYTQLLQSGLSNGEAQNTPLGVAALRMRASATVAEGIGQVLGLVPNPFVGFPSNFMELPVGTKLQQVFGTAARISHTNADIGTTTAGLRLTEAGWDRRADEWNHQKGTLGLELEQIRDQVLAAERRRDIALRELNTQQRQIEHSAEVHDFLRDRFTSHGLQLWLQQGTAALHAQIGELARHAARQAELAFREERGYRGPTMLPDENRDTLREGLLTGERMSLALHRMEQAYLDTNQREYELSKRVSLRTDFPLEFLRLLATGSCDITIPESAYDADHSGLYYRRIKYVSVTAPCVAGPHTGVHCRLTLLSSTTRISPALTDSAPCCPDGSPGHGYPALPGDPRLRTDYVGDEAILTSTGRENETGLAELSLQDARRLPFEFAGAAATMRIEIPPENNRWDLETLSDFFIDINYTAREGGPALRQAANHAAQHRLPGAGLCYLDAQVDLCDAWHQLQCLDGTRELELRITRPMFPFLQGKRGVRVTRIDLFVDVADAVPGSHHVVEFRTVGQSERQIRCVAGVDWPDFFHGTLDNIALGPLSEHRQDSLGTLRFPERLGAIRRVLLLCGYEPVKR
ncbi:neuraminidase-like domain-containing protein [Streptomyces sp. SAI-218]|uniref:Tc toxin subunit A-related protein n=1 Tax=Streptomyces sp. SAI-218 TaxID=3377736 RepID=UPI003C7D6B78